ncbi:HlyD family efflux transporter periplasmic adaptor subunit [Spiribacter sp. 221]|uniref:HlyD family efflux transporter periplasmic adaptor subunit n=1 Tax=Spiribacter onubensis TaxID=3122420 RepID=UPI00349F3000
MTDREDMRRMVAGRKGEGRERPGRFRRIVGIALLVVVVVAAGVMGERVVRTLDTSPRTSDAQIGAETTLMSAPVAGQVRALHVKENQRVSEGDILFRIDPVPYRLALRQAEANLAAISAELAEARRRAEAELANAGGAMEEIQRAEDDLALAERTVERLAPLAEEGVVSQQMYDEAMTARDNARTSLSQARQAAEASVDLVETTEALEAERDAARAAVELAQWELDRTTVVAPFDGLVAGLTASTGQYLLPGESIFTLIDDHSWHAIALVRETDLAGISTGDPAEVTVAINPGSPVEGEVESIGRGIQPKDDVDLAGQLPYVEATLDWVQVARRFPVRVRLSDPPDQLQHLGASARVVFSPADPPTSDGNNAAGGMR